MEKTSYIRPEIVLVEMCDDIQHLCANSPKEQYDLGGKNLDWKETGNIISDDGQGPGHNDAKVWDFEEDEN